MVNVVEETWSQDTFNAAITRAHTDDTNTLIQEFHMAFSAKFAPNSNVCTGPSARVLLKELFVALKRQGYEVVWLCHYNCPVVIEAAKIAKLSVHFYSANLLWENQDAIGSFIDKIGTTRSVWVIPHLFGRPSYLPFDLPKEFREQLFIIEDCAHTLGASLNGMPLGTCFDAGVFSFNLDKPISLLGGGILALNTERAQAYYETIESSPDDDSAALLQVASDWSKLKKVLHSRRALGRRLYQVKRKLGLVHTPRTSFVFGPARAALGLAALEDFDRVRTDRSARAERIFGTFSGRALPLPKQSVASYLRKRILVPKDDQRIALLNRLTSNGILSGNLNWPSVQGSNPAVFDQQWAAYGLDIPVDLFLDTDDEHIIIEALSCTDFKVL